jgi:hypothetical protein
MITNMTESFSASAELHHPCGNLNFFVLEISFFFLMGLGQNHV